MFFFFEISKKSAIRSHVQSGSPQLTSIAQITSKMVDRTSTGVGATYPPFWESFV